LTRTYIQSNLLLKSGAINAVSLRVESKPALFSMKRNGTAGAAEAENRKEFFASLGFDESSVVRGEQIHGDAVSRADSALNFAATDSLLTQRRNLLLTISVADCVPVLVFDGKIKAAAAVHSGWKGTAKNIVGKTANVLRHELNSNPEDIVAFIGPSAGACCYEVGEDVARHFSERHLKGSGKPGKFKLDLKRAIADQLIEAGIAERNIDVSERCSICDLNFHSFRRDGQSSGRMLAAIAIL
jgi:purine-nucleoside/S-methyl-5'-thioadenosine phosphorylase / adenosine deaminase